MNTPNLKELSAVISHLYGPNPSSEVLNTINAFKDYYLINLDASSQLFQCLIQSTNAHMNFWLIEQLILIVNSAYNTMTPIQRDQFRQSILMTIKHSITSIYQLPYITNKFCFLTITWLKYDFPQNSQSFFKDLISDIATSTDNNEKMKRVSFFIDILLTFDEELIKYRHTYTKFEADKSTLIKDYMRDYCINDIVFLISQIIDNEQYFDDKLVAKSIRLIAQLIDWNALNLFEVLIGKVLTSLIQKSKYQTECLEVVNSLIKKGMDYNMKMALIQQLNLLPLIDSIIINAASNEKIICIISEIINTLGLYVIDAYGLIKKSVKTGKNCDIEFNYCNELLMFSINASKRIICINNIGYKASLSYIDFISAVHSFLKIGENEVVQQVTINSLKEFIIVLAKSFVLPAGIDLVNDNLDKMEEDEFIVYRKEYSVIYFNFFSLKLLKEFMLDFIIDLSKTCQHNSNMAINNIENILYLINAIILGIKIEDLSIIQQKLADIIQLLFTFPFTETPSDCILLLYYDTITKYLPYLIDNTSALEIICKLYLSPKGIISSNTQTGIKIAVFFDKFIEKTKTLFLKGKNNHILKEIISKLKEYISMIVNSGNFYYIGQFELLFHSLSTALLCLDNINEKNKHYEEVLKSILSIFSLYGIDGEKFCEVSKCLTQLMNSINTEVKDNDMKQLMINFYDILFSEYYNKIANEKNKKIFYSMITILQRLILVLNNDSLKYLEFFFNSQFILSEIDSELFNENVKLLHNTISQFKLNSKGFIEKYLNIIYSYGKAIPLPNANISDIEKANLISINTTVKLLSIILYEIPEVFIDTKNIISIEETVQYMIYIAKGIIDQTTKKTAMRSLGNVAIYLMKNTTINPTTMMNILTWILNSTFEVYKTLDFTNQIDSGTVIEIMRIHIEIEKSGAFYAQYINKLINAEHVNGYITMIKGLNIKQFKLPDNILSGFNVRLYHIINNLACSWCLL